jgi:monoamine oxidase
VTNRSWADLVIVGAGAAGIGAARAAEQHGLSYVMFEAMDRVGGRAATDHETFGVPWDAGCHWLHSGSINVMRDFADSLGFRYLRDPVPWRLQRDRQPVPSEELEEVEQSFEQCYEAMLAAGRGGRDLAASTVVDRNAAGCELFEYALRAEWGREADAVSTLDASRYLDTDENWPVIDGYGALIKRLADGLRVELNAPVHRIDWRTRPVKVTTSLGTIETGRVLITVSTNILAAGLIEFDPALPDWKVDAAKAVPLGSANKVAFAIEGRHLGVESHTNITTPTVEGPLVGFQLRPYGADLVSGYLAGSLGRDAEEAGPDAMFELMEDALAGALGTGIRRHIGQRICSRWGVEPTIRGGYAAALPGRADERFALATPIEDTLYFGGEAVHPTFFSTCHGAFESGQAVVEQLVQPST